MIGPVSFFTPHMVGAMNVCPGSTTSVRGMPAIFYNRLIAERTTHVEQVSQITGKPLGPYHLSLADTAGGARTISFYQGPGNTDHTRFFEDRPVITLNWTEPDHQGNVFNSQQRDRILKAYYRGTTKGMDRTRLATGALSLAPYVNSLISLHTIVAEPQKDRIWLAFDNGYSGSQEKQQFSISSFFA